MFERLVIFFMKLFKRKKEQTYHYLFISMPMSFEDDTNNEDEGMIGKIVNVARNNHKENQNAIQKNEKAIQDANAKIDAIQEKIQSEMKLLKS